MEVHPITSFAQPYEVFKCIEGSEDYVALLESVNGPSNLSRYSIIGWGTKRYVKVDEGDSLEDKLLGALPQQDPEFKFLGNMVGYVSYDAVRQWERVRDLKLPAEKWPYAEFFLPENLIVYDHQAGKVYLDGDIKYYNCGEIGELKVERYDESMKKGEFEEGVKRVLEYIRAGYAFQVVLSRFYRFSYKGDLMRFYYNLRKVNPSPYMFYLKFGKRKVIGSSPELLFSVNRGIAESYPIAGTRPRGSTREEDLALEQELLASEKERAEHLMLVDLARNDLGKVCVPGTVKVPEFMYVEKYSHVQHIVSKVVGTLRKNLTPVDVLKATFPAGTVSGAPKPMAMNIIEEIEPFKRGPYAGAVGIVSQSSAEFAIAIRTAFVNDDLIRVQAGAGIVYDSAPEMEYYETEHKMKALLVSLGEKGGHNSDN
ncbi:MAG: anthranilate synthase component I [Candidatus Aramenus sp.]|jgi:anthranilate synthase component 1|nr:anthranilate synthase component I [Candidatus Aramenus sp.]